MNKFLRYPLIRIIVAVLFVGVGLVAGQAVLNLLRSALSIQDTAVANILAFVVITPAVYFAYALYVRLVEKRPLTELGFSHAAPEFGLGALVGFGLFALVIAILALSGSYRVTGFEFILLPVIGALLGAFVSALVQELIFRAAIYRITEEWLGTWWALAISAIVFGLIHLSSQGATIISALGVALEAGVIMAAAYALTHRVWMALGIHTAWDFANDGVFGVGVAGQTGEAIKGLFHADLSGPALLTGGAFGVEASIIAVLVVFLAGLALLWRARQKGQLVLR